MDLSPNSAILNSSLDVSARPPTIPQTEAGMQLSGDRLALDALANINAARPIVDKFRKQARECSDFNAGHHFGDEDKREMDITGRPTAAFNEAQKYIRFVSGLERQAQLEIQFLARDVHNDKQSNAGELTTKAYEWALQNSSGDDERSEAFWDLLETGMGWTDTSYERVVFPDGMVHLSRVPWDEMLWDIRARKKCLEDARWVARERHMSKAEAMRRWGRKHGDKIQLSLGMGTGSRLPNESYLYNEKSARPVDSTNWPSGIAPNEVCVYEYQWYDEDIVIEFADPFENKIATLPEDEFEVLHAQYKKALPALRRSVGRDFPDSIEHNESITRKYRRIIFVGQWTVEGPYELPGRRFTFNAMTGQWDNKDGHYYGFMRLLMDPQRYMTKFVNQVMEIITRSPKGGLLAESDAFVDPKRAEAEYGRSGAITWMTPGAIAQQKIQDKPAPVLPQGSAEMIQVCAAMLRETTGLDPSGVMGASGTDVPMVTLKQRQAASFVLLSAEFGSLHRYQINEARTIFDFLRLLADDRWVRVGTPYNAQAIQLVKDPFYMEYDVVLGEGTRDPASREQYMMYLRELYPVLSKGGLDVPELMDYLPLPASFIHKVKEAMAAKQEKAAENAKMGLQIGGRGKPTSMAEIQGRARKVNADADLTTAKAMKIREDLHTSRAKMLLDAYFKHMEMGQEERERQNEMGMDGVRMTKDIMDSMSREQMAQAQLDAQNMQSLRSDEE
mgnify:CR=1 FL=1